MLSALAIEKLLVQLAIATIAFVFLRNWSGKSLKKQLAAGKTKEATVIDVSPSDGKGIRKISCKYADTSGKTHAKTVQFQQKMGAPKITYLTMNAANKVVSRTLPINKYKSLSHLKVGDKLTVISPINLPQEYIEHRIATGNAPLYKHTLLQIVWAIIIIKYFIFMH